MLRKLVPNKRDRLILLPAIGSQFIVSTSLFLMPVLIDSLQVKAGLSGRAAGFLLSMELVVSACTTLFLSAKLHVHSTRRWALFGGLLAILGTVLTFVSPLLPALIGARLTAGIGAGIVGAEATSVLSRGIEREKLIAAVTISSIANAAIWLAILPYLVDRLGYRGPYACLLLINLIGTVLLRRLPSLSKQKGISENPARSPFNLAAMLVVAAIFLTQLGQGAFWSLEETFGRRAGFSSYTIGILLGAATLLLLLGAVGSAWASERFGRFSGMLILIVVNALSILFISTITVHWVFVAANILQSITNLSSVIYQLGLSASIDRTGRVIAASTGLVTLGNGLGPSLSASVSGAFGPSSVGVVVLAFNVIALMLYCAVKLRDTERQPLSASVT
ncbi:MFS transporter [Granulicella sp. L46]|uniref:MFS transporter n=1 Tax=Granulicella sp. L46 TaxID=1641865 RepID=UPI00131B0197|nr:MFS transporter [Granulicella sp. L46]